MFWASYYSSYTSELFSILENKLIGFADDSTLIAVVSSPGRATVAESLSRDLVRVSEWCDLWGMKLNLAIFRILLLNLDFATDRIVDLLVGEENGKTLKLNRAKLQ